MEIAFIIWMACVTFVSVNADFAGRKALKELRKREQRQCDFCDICRNGKTGAYSANEIRNLIPMAKIPRSDFPTGTHDPINRETEEGTGKAEAFH